MDHPFISYSRWRREEWKGHDGPEGVRRTIEYARRNSRPLRVFALVNTGIPGQAEFTEIPTYDWDSAFFAK